jgi:hypothetical protein
VVEELRQATVTAVMEVEDRVVVADEEVKEV